MELLRAVRHRVKTHVNRALEGALGVRIYSIRAHAREDAFDISKSGCRIETIFDVGANVGQSAHKFRDAFPGANVFCFEPVKSVFDELKKSVARDPRVRCFQQAMGSASATGKIYYTDHSTTSSLIEPEDSRGSEEVQVTTIDSFCREHGVERIDLLKVDAEGYDLEVLRGADSLLSAARVAFVLVELGFHPQDSRHALFDHAREFLMPRGFYVYGFYDQNLEWSGESRLRFANVCFANEAAFRK